MIAGNGFNSDHLFGLIGRTALSPVFMAALGGLIHLFSPQGRSFNIRYGTYLTFLAYRTFSHWRVRRLREPMIWNQETAVITGGANGIGWTLASSLAAKGTRVIILDVEAIPATNDNTNIIGMICDVANTSEVATCAARIIEKYDNPTILINNAGVIRPSTIINIKEEDIRKEMDVNYFSHVWLTRAFLPGMIKANSGTIISVASILGVNGINYVPGYCSSKAALFRFHDVLCSELANEYTGTTKVYASIIAPGHTNTRLFALPFNRGRLFDFLFPRAEPQEIADQIIQMIEAKVSAVRFTPYASVGGLLSHFLSPDTVVKSTASIDSQGIMRSLIYPKKE